MNDNGGFNRRDFLRGSTVLLAGSSLTSGVKPAQRKLCIQPVRGYGPASKYIPTVKAAFVRRKEDYGMWWPGAVYDGRAARQKYSAQLMQTAETLGVKLELRAEPIYNSAEANAWLAEVKAAEPDGQILVLLDRQKHSWPTAYKAAKIGVPTVIFSPLGTSFTTNTAKLAERPGCVVYSTAGEDSSQLSYGMKMLEAGAKIRRTRCVVLKGSRQSESSWGPLQIRMRYVPAQDYLDEYRNTATGDEVLAMADDYLQRARQCTGSTRQDVINGAKGYFAARKILEREEADAITMDCLGALGRSKVSLPCLAWSRMNDDGIPAACEADLGAVASHIIVQYLFDRPGFQQDPVADTAHQAIIGAHCTCATRLKGFGQPPEPFDLIHHHGLRDATIRPLWQKGQRVTSIDVLPPGSKEENRQMLVLISTGTVLDNISAPPNGGCVVSVRVRFDGEKEVLSFPGFHQIFFYGDYKRELEDFCKLFNFKAQVV